MKWLKIEEAHWKQIADFFERAIKGETQAFQLPTRVKSESSHAPPPTVELKPQEHYSMSPLTVDIKSLITAEVAEQLKPKIRRTSLMSMYMTPSSIISSTNSPPKLGDILPQPATPPPPFIQNDKSHRRNSIPVYLVNDLKLAPLKELDFLSLHLNQVETLSKQLGIIEEHSGSLRILPGLEVAFIMKFQESVANLPKVEACIRQNASRINFDYAKLKEILNRNFCSRAMMGESYNRRLYNLRFQSVNKVESFIADCSMIMALIVTLYGMDLAEFRIPVRDILKTIPDFIRNSIIDELIERSAGISSWELAVPFDDECAACPAFKCYEGSTTIIDILRQKCLKSLETSALQGNNRGNTGNTGKGNNDNVRRVTDDDFTEKYKHTYLLYGNACRRPESAMDKLKKIGFTGFKQLLSRNNNPIMFIGTDDAKAEKKLKDLGRLFIFSNLVKPKNSSEDLTSQ